MDIKKRDKMRFEICWNSLKQNLLLFYVTYAGQAFIVKYAREINSWIPGCSKDSEIDSVTFIPSDDGKFKVKFKDGSLFNSKYEEMDISQSILGFFEAPHSPVYEFTPMKSSILKNEIMVGLAFKYSSLPQGVDCIMEEIIEHLHDSSEEYY